MNFPGRMRRKIGPEGPREWVAWLFVVTMAAWFGWVIWVVASSGE